MDSSTADQADRSAQSALRHYKRALTQYGKQRDQAMLASVREIGRAAIEAQVGIPEIAEAHHSTMAPVLLRALVSADSSQARDVVGMFCASCPASTVSEEELPAGCDALDKFFSNSLSRITASHEALLRANEGLKRTSQICESEAKRISRDLHDEAGQLLGSVHLRLEEVAEAIGPAHRERIQGVRDLLHEVEDHLRRIAHELRPMILDDLGLMPALEFLAEGVSKRSKISISVRGNTNGRLDGCCETAIYRVAQEALTNIMRHSKATRAVIGVKRENGEVVCTITDNGKGFRQQDVFGRLGQRGLGLVGIQGRVDALGGWLEIESAPGKGTKVSVRLPAGLPSASIPVEELLAG